MEYPRLHMVDSPVETILNDSLFKTSRLWRHLTLLVTLSNSNLIAFLYKCGTFFNLLKVTGDSLLIHEFAYSLFIGLCSVTFKMTSNSHLYHSIKLIHSGAPQRDVLSDKMML